MPARDTVGAPALHARSLCKSFRREGEAPAHALVDVSLQVRHGELTALVGPDGAGKTTLMRLATGLLRADSGALQVLGIDVTAHPQQIQDRVGYMPQRFGLYEDLSVAENLDLYADLHGIDAARRAERYPALMQMTALGPFQRRLAGQLSGGMKQKLGLACALIRAPQLLLLDEPTVGVDPLSRRELWDIVQQLVDEQGLTVLVTTAYLDEAERCQHAIILQQGRILAQGQPGQIAARAAGRVFLAMPAPGQKARALQAQLLAASDVIDAVPQGGQVRYVRADAAGARPADARPADAQPVAPRFEDGFMMLLRQTAEHESATLIRMRRPPAEDADAVAVHVQELRKSFGRFTAVDGISFQVRRGEIFGLLGPNGAGKTTTFRMLCGLLRPSGGELRVAGADVRHAPATARARLGYMAQKFSLYGALSVSENLEFFAGAYGLRGGERRERIAWALQQFELTGHARSPATQLPGGFRQRLSLAAALLHEPQILFLDEPTSGADPLARRAFWARINSLSEQGVTVIVTTHFMEEAEYCDHVAIMDAGEVLAQGSPAQMRALGATAAAPDPPMEAAFLNIIARARSAAGGARGAA